MTARSVSMPSATINFKLVGLIVLIVLAFVVGAVLLPTNTQATVVGEVTARGRSGYVETTGAELNVYIKVSKGDGSQCEYKPYWSNGDQIGSGFFFPCDEAGYQALLDLLFHDRGTFRVEIYNALKGFKFW